MATAASTQIVGKPLQLMSYEEQRRQKIEDCLMRRKYANSVADQARSRLASRVYLKDKTNFERDQAAERQTEARVFEGGKEESKKPIQNRTTCQSSTRSESTLSKQRAKPSIKNTNSDTSETKMPAEQIAQPEKLPSSAQENNLKVEQKSKGNTSVATNETKLPAQQTVESEKLPLDQKNNSDIEQKSKGKSQPKMQNVMLSQSFLLVKNEQAKLIAEEKRSNKPKASNSTFKKPVLGSFRGKIVESKIQSFRSSSPQNKKQEKSDLVTSGSVTEMQNKESRGKLHKPRPKGVENVHPVRRTLNVTSHSKQKSLTAATGLSTPNSQKLLTTDVLKIKLDFKQSGSGDIATAQIVSVPSAKKTAVPFQNTSKGVPARLPGWKLSKVGGNHKPMKHTESTEEKRSKLTQWMTSKGKLLKRPAITPLQRKTIVEEPVKSIWTTIAEEDNEGEFENKINQSLSECLKRIKEGCPNEDALQTLQTFIESVPKAKKFVRYWICLAQLEQRKGSVHGVMTVYEQAIRMGAQPAEELRNTLADILKNTKTPKKPCDAKNKTEDDGAQQDPELEMYCMTEQKLPEKEVDLAANEQKPSREENVYCTDDKQDLPLEEQAVCIAATDEHSVSKENERDPMANEQQLSSDEGVDLTADEQQLSMKQEVEPTTEEQPPPSLVDEVDGKEGCEVETKENYVGDYEIEEVYTIEDMKTPAKQIMTPNKIENRGSSVKYNVKATSNSQCARNIQLEKSNSMIKDVKFLTPVRRSLRIEQRSSQLPLMLQDHDPSVSSLEDLKKLGEVSTAYAFKVNSALPECTNISTE